MARTASERLQRSQSREPPAALSEGAPDAKCDLGIPHAKSDERIPQPAGQAMHFVSARRSERWGSDSMYLRKTEASREREKQASFAA